MTPYKSVTFDLGYAIMANGDIVTSDGQSRMVSEVDLRQAEKLARRKLDFKFRVPRPDEIEELRKQGILP